MVDRFLVWLSAGVVTAGVSPLPGLPRLQNLNFAYCTAPIGGTAGVQTEFFTGNVHPKHSVIS